MNYILGAESHGAAPKLSRLIKSVCNFPVYTGTQALERADSILAELYKWNN